LSQIFKGLKTLVFNVVFFAFSYFLVSESQSFWLQHSHFIGTLLIGLFLTVIVLASYFNRSRLALFSSVIFAYYINVELNLFVIKSVTINSVWL
jgi:hypothetical protein